MSLDVEQALVSRLLNTSAVSTLIGTRMHPLRLPDTAVFPAIVYTEVSAPITATHDETANSTLTHARYQIDAWATTYSGSVVLAKAIFEALHSYSGIITKGADTFRIYASLRQDRRKDNDPETGLFRVMQDFMIWY